MTFALVWIGIYCVGMSIFDVISRSIGVESSASALFAVAASLFLYFWLKQQGNLTRRITELTEELEELKTEKEMVLRSLDCADDAGISAVKKEIATLEGALQKLSEQEEKYSAELDEALKQYAKLKEQAAAMDVVELIDSRLAIREEKERSAVDRVKAAYGEKYDPIMMHDSKRDVANLLHKEAESRSVRECLRQKQQAQQRQKNKRYEQER